MKYWPQAKTWSDMVTIRSGLVQRIEKCQRLEDRFILGDRAFYQGNWLMRAAAAKGGIYGNDSVEAKRPVRPPTRKRKVESSSPSRENFITRGRDDPRRNSEGAVAVK